MIEDLQDDWRTVDERAQDVDQAGALKEQASKGGLRFETYLPSDLAAWVLDLVERGVFADPSEAVFVILGEHRELEAHIDLRQESLKRSLDAAINDPRPTLSSEEVEERMKKLLDEPRPAPAVWQKRSAAPSPSLEAIEALTGMKHADIRIGMEFLTATGRWRVTDVGTRTVIAIKLDQTNPRNYNGPPYSIVEEVFDEYDLEGCGPVERAD
jgi:antitoxin ParD1/3/4